MKESIMLFLRLVIKKGHSSQINTGELELLGIPFEWMLTGKSFNREQAKALLKELED